MDLGILSSVYSPRTLQLNIPDNAAEAKPANLLYDCRIPGVIWALESFAIASALAQALGRSPPTVSKTQGPNNPG